MLPVLPRPHRDDVLIAAGGLAGGVVLWHLGLFTNVPARRDPGALPLLPLIAMAAAELLRRVAQPLALLMAVAAVAADQYFGSLIATVLMFTDIVYASVVYGPSRTARQVIPASILVTVGLTVWAVSAVPKPESLFVGVVAALVTIAPAWTGLTIRQHQKVADEERLRAEQATLLSEMDRWQAVEAERGRVARELHDLVANHLSAIAIQSTAALSLNDPKASTDALGVIRTNSVQALAEMRRLIGLLRSGEAEDEVPSAAPTLAGLNTLVDRARAGGSTSGLTFVAEDTRGKEVLPAPVKLAAYRIVQESLTNALKHASPGVVTVCLNREAAGPLTVEVTSPYTPRVGSRAPGSGAGLVGMRERVALLDGEFEAGPVGTAGSEPPTVWRVCAVLPVEEKGPV
ncbi:sensor histidine kinase [Streptomyces sp. NRRL F-5650]|uniref:sensor histidine kinase n=1 Tax=Streptomyces sp. NRRL F-5650 TaxID=1463868 RepID=UPI0004C533BA|nr:histidine kinase [Streptomyces sp. NRRL F-5650]